MIVVGPILVSPSFTASSVNLRNENSVLHKLQLAQNIPSCLSSCLSALLAILPFFFSSFLFVFSVEAECFVIKIRFHLKSPQETNTQE